MHSFQSMSVLCQTQTYTRAKRFKKYLARACMRQSNNSVPDQTWKYLLDRRPYKGPRHILRVLKGAGRTLRKKCYDCLPMLVHHLCDIKVPVLCDLEVASAMELFKVIDAAFPKEGGFMSYAYALEFILCKLNREDLLPFLSGIQCTKRRAHYHQLLTRVFKGESVGETRLVSGQTLSDFGSKAASVVSDTMLPWHKPCYRVDPSTCSRWWVWCNVYLIEQDRARSVLRKVLKSLEVETCDACGSGCAHFE